MAVNNGANGIIDVKPIYNGELAEIPFSFELPEENEDENYGFDDITFKTPVTVSGKIARRATGRTGGEDYAELELNVSADISAECARCLKEVSEKIEFSQVYALRKAVGARQDEDSGDDEYITVRNGAVDIFETARSMFLLNIPMRFLCDENCKGICFKCGKNLNEGSCGCSDEKEVDPRLAGLMKLLDDSDDGQ